MKAVGYVRVSSDKQVVGGRSLSVQRKSIESFAADNGLVLMDIFEDAGLSGRTLDRPGLRSALGSLQNGTAHAIIVTALDRLTRSALDAAALLRNELHAPDSLFVIDDAIDDKAEVSSKRTKEAMAHMKANGDFTGGQAPYGYAVENGKLVPVEGEQEVIRVAKDLRATGLSLREVGKELVSRGLVPRTAKSYSPAMIKRMCQWDVAQIRRMVNFQ